jgi:hypothetical protein
VYNGQDAYEVTYKEHKFTVNLDNKTCSCKYWQLSGLPCPHAISVIHWKSSCLDDFLANCYSIDDYRKIYDYCMQPVEGMHCWPMSDRPRPRAPNNMKMPRRPRTCRKREAHEKPKKSHRMYKTGTKIRCSRCQCYGHNRSTCEKINGQGQSTMAANQHESRTSAIAENDVTPIENYMVTCTETSVYCLKSILRTNLKTQYYCSLLFLIHNRAQVIWKRGVQLNLIHQDTGKERFLLYVLCIHKIQTPLFRL